MSSLREQIVADAATAVTTGRPADVPAPVRTRIDSPSADQLPALSVYQLQEEVAEMLDPRPGQSRRGPAVRRTLRMVAQSLTKSGANVEADKAADPLLCWASKAMAAWAGAASFKGFECREVGTNFEYETGETSFCRATMLFEIQFLTLAGDPELSE